MIDPAALDSSIKPGDDFFGYVNDRWIAAHPIPPEESRWGSFTALRVDVEKQLKSILEDLAAGQEIGPVDIAQKVRAFYTMAMDADCANRLGLSPLDGIMEDISGIRDTADLPRVIGRLHRIGVRAWWVSYIAQDEKNTEVMALHPYQGGLGLPDRDYYLNDDEKSRDIRAKYMSYMESMLARIGVCADMAKAIMAVETRLAQASMTRVELRDPEKQYNKMTLPEMDALMPHFSWPAYLDAIAAPAVAYAIVGQPAFMKTMDALIGELPLDVSKNYLRWCAVNSLAVFLTEDLERAQFDFYGKTFNGVTEMKPRWRRVLAVANEALDEAVGQLYVARHFSPEAKRRVNDLVDHLIAAYRGRIRALSWMSDATKEKALEKLSSFSRKLGYPDKWKDYAALAVDGVSYAENYMKVHRFEFDRQVKKIGQPVDRTEWYMSPQTVNACYQPPMNEILFPAAILQPPFFDPQADDAANFGGIGTVIGHELTHGFDDEGSMFDAKGNLANWWTAEDRKNFEERAERLAAQYDAYEPVPGVHVNGHLTLGENIADLGGLLIGHDGLQLLFKEKSRPEKVHGLTPEERFFIAYAITERGHSREEHIRMQVQVDPHSPNKFRVNGPVSNLEVFYDTYGVKEGDKLWRTPDDRVRIW